MTSQKTLRELRDDWDWNEAFGRSGKASNPITREVEERQYKTGDVVEIVAISVGENDERPWVGLFLMDDGRYLFVDAWCDYTGWDCQSGGSAEWFRTKEEAVACISAEARERLGL